MYNRYVKLTPMDRNSMYWLIHSKRVQDAAIHKDRNEFSLTFYFTMEMIKASMVSNLPGSGRTTGHRI